ncbi:DUF559 domain-containing protein, partial [Candidatus Amoebophilus asiaticus]|nr:DUF559 domain-containing protein [Candidatus Amoebophilus asiaticus]
RIRKIIAMSTNMIYGANPILFEFARQLRHNETEAEKLLWEKLKKNQIYGLRFKRQRPIMYFIADFYCHHLKLIIEIDGGIHQIPEQYESDQNRDHELDYYSDNRSRFNCDCKSLKKI